MDDLVTAELLIQTEVDLMDNIGLLMSVQSVISDYSTNVDFSSCKGFEVPRDTKSMLIAAVFASLLGTSTNIVVTTLSSSWSASSNLFGLFNQIQLVIIIPLIGPYIPQKTYDYLKSMSTSLFKMNFMQTAQSVSNACSITSSRTCTFCS